MDKKPAGKHKTYTAEELEVIKEEGRKLRKCLVDNFERVYRESYRNYGQAAGKIGGISGVSLSQYVSGITRIPDRQLLKICNALEIATQSIRENEIYEYDEYYVIAIHLKFLVQEQNIRSVEFLSEKTGLSVEYFDSVFSLHECNLKKNDIDSIAKALDMPLEELKLPWNDLKDAHQDPEFMKFLTDNWLTKGFIVNELMTAADELPISEISRQFGQSIAELALADDISEIDMPFFTNSFIRLMEETMSLLKEKGVTLDDATKLKLIKLLTE